MENKQESQYTENDLLKAFICGYAVAFSVVAISIFT